MTERVDPLSLRVFANLFSSVADEMGITLQRAAFSPNIKMRRDFSCAIFDVHGALLAQAAHIPVHLGAMPMAMTVVRETFDLRPGDVVILNDPYNGGTHLPDISLVSASYSADGRRVGYVMCRAHHSDIGGMSAGSMPLSTDIHQEGLIIPPVLLFARGELNEGVMRLLLSNVRTPVERRGDLEAQLAAQRLGESQLAALDRRYGAEALAAHGSALQDYAELMMRQTIARIPPGVYSSVDYLDDDGQEPDAVRVSVTICKGANDSDLEIDFSGSSLQRAGCINAVSAVTVSATLYVMACLQPEDVPVNQGSLRPLRIIAPEETVVAARFPAAVAGGNVETSQRIVDVLFRALSGALPDVVPAASQGTMNNLALGGIDDRTGVPFAYYETMGGGVGARPTQDGASGVHDHMSNTLNTPVEALEHEYPMRVERYCLRRGTGGRGRFGGGEGLERDLRFLVPTQATILSERRIFSPYGLKGGADGASGVNALLRGAHETALPGKCAISGEPGDVLSLRSPGGGGWGELSVSDDH